MTLEFRAFLTSETFLFELLATLFLLFDDITIIE